MSETPVTATQEDYLEAILFLAEEEGGQAAVRSRDLAKRLNTHKSTVSNTLRVLVDKELIDFEPYGGIRLTEKGRSIAERVAHNHRLIMAFLQNTLLMDPQKAEENACRIEHVVDAEVVERLALFSRHIGNCPDSAGHCFSRYSSHINGLVSEDLSFPDLEPSSEKE
ncbi:hypothetical protein CSB20_12365 [bacterium DOLZORAL124_64_63]|nr:MAG: hypothetical protein CSB20_12365 [bacterium DOLZORAL124_64_63]